MPKWAAKVLLGHLPTTFHFYQQVVLWLFPSISLVCPLFSNPLTLVALVLCFHAFTLFLLFKLFHVLDILINQNWPSRWTFIVLRQVGNLIAEVQKGRPLIEGDAGVSFLLFNKYTKGLQAVVRDAAFQNHFEESHDQFLVQGSVGALTVELKAKLNRVKNWLKEECQ